MEIQKNIIVEFYSRQKVYIIKLKYFIDENNNLNIYNGLFAITFNDQSLRKIIENAIKDNPNEDYLKSSDYQKISERIINTNDTDNIIKKIEENLKYQNYLIDFIFKSDNKFINLNFCKNDYDSIYEFYINFNLKNKELLDFFLKKKSNNIIKTIDNDNVNIDIIKYCDNKTKLLLFNSFKNRVFPFLKIENRILYIDSIIDFKFYNLNKKYILNLINIIEDNNIPENIIELLSKYFVSLISKPNLNHKENLDISLIIFVLFLILSKKNKLGFILYDKFNILYPNICGKIFENIKKNCGIPNLDKMVIVYNNKIQNEITIDKKLEYLKYLNFDDYYNEIKKKNSKKNNELGKIYLNTKRTIHIKNESDIDYSLIDYVNSDDKNDKSDFLKKYDHIIKNELFPFIYKTDSRYLEDMTYIFNECLYIHLNKISMEDIILFTNKIIIPFLVKNKKLTTFQVFY